MKKVKVLIIGQGFMGGIAHPRAILEANQQLRPRGIELVLSVIAGRDAKRLPETQIRYGFERAATDWKAEIGKADVVVVTTPNRAHREMAVAALRAGKAVVCEKPLGASLEEAREMAGEARKAGTPTMVTFCYQGAPGRSRRGASSGTASSSAPPATSRAPRSSCRTGAERDARTTASTPPTAWAA
jgi:predicted dehydrogenase